MFNFVETNQTGQEAVDTMLKSCSAMASGVQAIATEAADYSKKSYEEGASMIERLAGARSMEKVFEIQTGYARSSYEAFVQQTARVGEIYADLAKDVYKPFARTRGKTSD